jgi:drug/metabolite transporter (DMT)-like permease
VVDKRSSFVAIHLAVLLFALSGLFAKWLILPAIVIVIGRAFFAAVSLAAYIGFIKQRSILLTTNKYIVALAVTGAVLAIHWASFFQAIKVANVAIGLITFASFPVFVALLEPWLFQEKFQRKTIIQALLTLVGIALILPYQTLEREVIIGAVWGIVSAFTFAILTILNRKFVTNLSASIVALYQNAFACVILLPYFYFFPLSITSEQWLILLLLGVVFTALSHTLFNHALKNIKAHTASIAVSLEPIYGIIAAYFLVGESLTFMMTLGGVIVVATNIWALKTNEKLS